MPSQYIATFRLVLEADSEIDARLAAELLREKAIEDLDDESIFDITQLIPISVDAVEPTELVNEMRHVADKLVATRIRDCYDLAQWLDKTAWILEHRTEASFDPAGYDYGTFLERAGDVLKRVKGKGNEATG